MLSLASFTLKREVAVSVFSDSLDSNNKIVLTGSVSPPPASCLISYKCGENKVTNAPLKNLLQGTLRCPLSEERGNTTDK